MKIEKKKAFDNKTWRFLVPAIRGYGDTFVRKFNSQIVKLAYGISDRILEGTEILKDRRPIFILCDATALSFESFLEWLKQQYYYITDYQYYTSDPDSVYHMLVIDIPEQYNKAYDKFIVGLYSEMYTDEELETLFRDKESEQYQILSRSPKYREKFLNKIKEQFDVYILDNEKDSFLGSAEFELPYLLTPEDEIFNY